MTSLQAFIAGIIVAWSPSLLLIAWVLYRKPTEISPQRRKEI